MTEYLKFTIIGEDEFSGVFDKLKAQMPSLRTAATAAATGIAALGTTLFAMTKSTANAYDEIRDLSNRLGVSTEELSKLKYAASLSGVSLDELSTSLKFVSNNIVEASKGSGAAYESLNKLGLSVKDLINLSPDEQFEKVADKLSKVDNASQRTAIAMDVFGRSGTSVLQMLDKGVEGLNEMKQEAEDLGLVIGTQAAANADAFNDALTKLQGALTGAKNGIGEQLMPQITAFTTYLTDNMQPILETIAASFKTLMTVFYGFKVVAESVITAVIANFTALADIAATVFNGLSAAAHGRLGEAWATLKSGFQEVVIDYKAGAEQIVADVQNAVEKIKGLWSDPEVVAPKIKSPALSSSGSDTTTTAPLVQNMIGNPEEILEQGEAAAEALQEVFEDMMGPVIDENYENEYTKQQEAYEALSQLHDEYFMSESERLDQWYLEQQQKFAGNQAALKKVEDIYRADKKKLDQQEKKESLMRSANFFSDLSTIALAFGKKGAKMAKAFSIAETIINTYKAATGAYSALASIPFVGPALGIAAAAAATASGLANVQRIRNTEIKGIAHGGMTSVPAESTYILNKGERVLSPNQNKDLTDFIHGGGQPVNQTNNFTLFPNATNTESLLTIPVSRWKEVCESRIIPAMRQLNWGAY